MLTWKDFVQFCAKSRYQIYNANSISIIWKNNFGKSQKVQFYNFSKLSWFMYKNGLIWKLTWHFFCHIIFLAKLQFYRIQFSIFLLYKISFFWYRCKIRQKPWCLYLRSFHLLAEVTWCNWRVFLCPIYLGCFFLLQFVLHSKYRVNASRVW